MDEELTGRPPGEATTPEEPGLAERLIREEFGEPSTPPVPETAPVPAVAVAPSPAASTTSPSTPIHVEFSEPPARPPRSRSHRTGMLAGLGVVGALLAALVLLSPGSGAPRLPAQSVHDVSPISSSGPKTAAAIVTPPPASSTTTTTPAPASDPMTTTTPSHKSEVVPSTVTYASHPATTTPAATPTTAAPTPSPTTAPPAQPPTTTTTLPPSTTTTTHCLLGLLCG